MCLPGRATLKRRRISALRTYRLAAARRIYIRRREATARTSRISAADAPVLIRFYYAISLRWISIRYSFEDFKRYFMRLMKVLQSVRPRRIFTESPSILRVHIAKRENAFIYIYLRAECHRRLLSEDLLISMTRCRHFDICTAGPPRHAFYLSSMPPPTSISRAHFKDKAKIHCRRHNTADTFAKNYLSFYAILDCRYLLELDGDIYSNGLAKSIIAAKCLYRREPPRGRAQYMTGDTAAIIA